MQKSLSGVVEQCEVSAKSELAEMEACLSRPSPSMMTMLFEDPGNWAKKKSPSSANTVTSVRTVKTTKTVQGQNVSTVESSEFYNVSPLTHSFQAFHEYSESFCDNNFDSFDDFGHSSNASFDISSFISQSSKVSSASTTKSGVSQQLMYQLPSGMRCQPDFYDDDASYASDDYSRSGCLSTICEEEGKSCDVVKFCATGFNPATNICLHPNAAVLPRRKLHEKRNSSLTS